MKLLLTENLNFCSSIFQQQPGGAESGQRQRAGVDVGPEFDIASQHVHAHPQPRVQQRGGDAGDGERGRERC